MALTPTLTFGRLVLRGDGFHKELRGMDRRDPAAGATGPGFGPRGDETGRDRFLLAGGLTV